MNLSVWIRNALFNFLSVYKKQNDMKILRLRTSMAIFILFFGISTLEAFRTRNWLNAAFWVAIAIMFLVVDNIRDEEKSSE